jgi:N-acetylglucosaminyldiphosphoundecaprenol N-acetyl-beta-D-mannosaminyltransferase
MLMVAGDGLPTVQLRGARVHAITEVECAQLVMTELAARRGGWIITLNLEHMQRFERDPMYAACYAHATLVLADGMPLVWASRLQGTPLPERVTGSNLIYSLSEAAAAERRSIFLLGGNPNAATRTAQALQARYPQLRVAGCYYPASGFEQNEQVMTRLIRALVDAEPDIIYVALGAPKEEVLIQRVQSLLPAAWWLGVGITFSFVSGEIPRAPLWMQQNGLEWLHRLSHEPRRLARRYLIRGIPFALLLFASAVRRRLVR